MEHFTPEKTRLELFFGHGDGGIRDFTEKPLTAYGSLISTHGITSCNVSHAAMSGSQLCSAFLDGYCIPVGENDYSPTPIVFTIQMKMGCCFPSPDKSDDTAKVIV